MLRTTRRALWVTSLPDWLRTAKENKKDTLPPRDFHLKELKREDAYIMKYYKKLGWKHATKPTPLNIKEYSFFGFAMIVMPYALYQQRKKWKTLEEVVGLNIDEEVLKSGDMTALERMRDPDRPPWPLLHFETVEMREGKRGLDQIQDIWHKVNYYYPNDWLLAIEFTQILKMNSALYLSQFVADPEQMRKEVYEQLTRVKHTRKSRKITNDVIEIVRAAAEDIEKLDFKKADAVALVPVNT